MLAFGASPGAVGARAEFPVGETASFAPFPAFVRRAQATEAKPRLAVELAEFDAGRPSVHARALGRGSISIVMWDKER
jgi:hypothetical protein